MKMSKDYKKGSFSRDDRDLSNDISIDDIHPGDIWWANYPFEEDEVLDDNLHSTEGKIRPVLVLNKRDDRVLVAKGTTSKNQNYIDSNDIETINSLIIDCNRYSRLKPHDLLEKEDHIDISDPAFKNLISKMRKTVKDKDIKVRKWEQAEGNERIMNLDLLEESPTNLRLVMSEDDIYCNYKNWLFKKSHVIFVIGLSGSGKTTLAKKLAAQSKAKVTYTDTLAFGIAGYKRAVDKGHGNYEWIEENDEMLCRYLKEKGIDPMFLSDSRFDVSKARPTRDPQSEEIVQVEMDKYIHWLCFEQKERVVIEGGHGAVTITRHENLYKKMPIVIKGTSIGKSMLRRTIRDFDEPKDLILRPYILVTQYAKMIPEMNKARAIAMSDDNELWYMKEDTILTESVKEAIPSGIKDFNEFCHKIKDCSMCMKWFVKNKIKWPEVAKGKNGNDNPFYWPDFLIKYKQGNCFDQTIFMHYFCKKKRIGHKMFIITWDSDNGKTTGHAVPIYEKGGYVWTWLYLSPGHGLIGGPFRDYDDAKRVLDNYFLIGMNKALGAPSTAYSSYLTDQEMENFDKYYNDRSVTQMEYITGNYGANMSSTHLFKIRLAGHAIPNPIFNILRSMSVLMEVYKLMSNRTDSVKEEYNNL